MTCGYSESERLYDRLDGIPVIFVKDDITVKMSILGRGMDMHIRNEYVIDSATGKFSYCKHANAIARVPTD